MTSVLPVSLLPVSDDTRASQRILATLEGRLPKVVKKKVGGDRKNGNESRRYLFATFFVLAAFVLVAGGYFLHTQSNSSNLHFPERSVSLPTEQPSTEKIAQRKEAVQKEDSIESIDAAVINAEGINDVEARNPLSVISEQKDPLASLSSEAEKTQENKISRTSPTTDNTVKKSRRNNRPSAQQQNSPTQDADVSMLTSMLEAIYQDEPKKRTSPKNNTATRLAECDKLDPHKREQCRENVCSNLWGRVSECVLSTNSGK